MSKAAPLGPVPFGPVSYDATGALCLSSTPLAPLAAQFGSPLYVYSGAHISAQIERLQSAFAALNPLICYAVKANMNTHVIRHVASHGVGADVVSVGELRRALAAGVSPEKIVFAGVAKQPAELEAGLETGILQFNVESWSELEALNAAAARMGTIAPVALRVNPDVDAQTLAKITTGSRGNKFGLPFDDIPSLVQQMQTLPHVRLEALAMHIGSQLFKMQPFSDAYKRLADLTRHLSSVGTTLQRLDIGGGLGIPYAPEDGDGPDPVDLAAAATEHLAPLGLPTIVEPGRFIVGNAGVMIADVVYTKESYDHHFLLLNAGMNDLMRPALYEAYHHILPLQHSSAAPIPQELAGPICESTDVFAKQRPLPPLEEGAQVAFLTAGAYCAVLANHYNGRALPAEVLLSATGEAKLIRPAVSDADMIALEQAQA
ncbi:MAG: diaminopimelate decarboxylase [Geminicoccus sp.]|nr:diaminopimelate decarboxylase [Geminicoccus sp.]